MHTTSRCKKSGCTGRCSCYLSCVPCSARCTHIDCQNPHNLGTNYGKCAQSASATASTTTPGVSEDHAEIGKRSVWSITSGEKGKTHTIMSCAFASGFVLPPFIIYPKKRLIPDYLKERRSSRYHV